MSVFVMVDDTRLEVFCSNDLVLICDEIHRKTWNFVNLFSAYLECIGTVWSVLMGNLWAANAGYITFLQAFPLPGVFSLTS